MLNSISIIITTGFGGKERKNNLRLLLQDIKQQSITPKEVILIVGTSPRTKAHNQGAQKATSDILCFLDDDIRIPNPKTLNNLIYTLNSNPKLGIVGCPILNPPNSTTFQKKCDEQLLTAKGMIAHACLAIPRALYWQVGGEDEKLFINDDALLNHKIQKLGLETQVISTEFPVFHPHIKNLNELIFKYFELGKLQANDYKANPSAILNTNLKKPTTPASSNLKKQIFRNFKIISMSFRQKYWFLLISRIATAAGFIKHKLIPRALESKTGKIIFLATNQKFLNKKALSKIL